MGVSSDTTDLSLLVSGGEAFAQRITELKTAKDSFDRALSDLNLGKAATAANDEAHRVLSEAKVKRDAEMAALDAELSQARSGLNIWVEETKAAITASYNEAQTTLSGAKAEQEAAALAKEAAQTALTDAKTETASLIKDANAQAADILAKAQAEASKIIAAADKIDKDARKALSDAQASKDKYDTAMELIKSAAVG